MACKCKVGPCNVPGCESSCKRCGCSCDGVAPAEALARKAGGNRRKKRDPEKELLPDDVKAKRQRATAEVANKRIRDIANEEDIADKADAGTPLTREAVWKFFHFSDSQQKNLPSKAASLNASVHDDESPRGKQAWSTICQTAISVLEQTTTFH